jgi:hypothetical protein
MDMLIWINTLAILFVLLVGGIIVLSEMRKITEALRGITAALKQIADTTSRTEQISVAILQRLSISDTPQA